jgi:sugar O-acyltransferase (sialic acid O-acetyltransferase NeuD family)
MKRKDILLIGAGGHALSCIDVLLVEDNHRIVGLVGRSHEVGLAVGGVPVIGADSDLPKLLGQVGRALVTVGQIESAGVRMRLFEIAVAAGAEMPVVVSPRACVSPRSRLGAGTIVMHMAVVNAGAEVGRNCIVNTRALVEHGARVGDHCHIATGAILNGDATLGEGAFLGSGAVVRQGVAIGESAFVRMGELVKRDLPAGHGRGKGPNS